METRNMDGAEVASGSDMASNPAIIYGHITTSRCDRRIGMRTLTVALALS